MNVDIFVCIDFRGSLKIGNFACIKIRVFSTSGSLAHYECNFHHVHIFAHIGETRITRQYVQRENYYVHSSSDTQIIYRQQCQI